MDDKRLEILKEFLEKNISAILLEDVTSKVFDDAIVLESNCNRDILTGHYDENGNYKAPEWFYTLEENVNKGKPFLVIENIDYIPEEEQLKFLEIIKYKKISTFELPENTITIVTCRNPKEKPIAEEIYTLLAHI